ncbi:sulfatase [Engelhardtia mirabilis]|uniref:Arylsulfatase n=1 Tax=Engelhardtia mirabilis TaxID=2528011 RepID=A0A518BJR2_9BACT|nr:Arylsulfatase [Planctomycetes bacterium Pla133]QDV01535.1 Arylsulfatase [Planctomycetes bacterium Pla86]
MHRCAPARRVAAVLFFALVGCSAPDAADHSERREARGLTSRPNIVFILADDHAIEGFGAYGSERAYTPNLDRLAAEGLLFENAFCENSLCGPSRAAFLTGAYSHVHGFRQNGNSFDPSLDTFPRRLHDAGYQTALYGKWHLGSDPQGFDDWAILPGQGNYYSPDFIGPDGKFTVSGYVSDVVTDMAVEWLREERDPDAPFLLHVHHKAPHRTWMPGPQELSLWADEDLPEPATLFDDWSGRAPAAAEQEMTIANHLWPAHDLKLPIPAGVELTGPDRWAQALLDRMSDDERAAWDAHFGPRNDAFLADPPEGDERVRWNYQRYIKNYLRSVAGVDRNVGRLLAELDELGLAENTLIVYASDQGFYLGEHGWYDKRWMYEESLRLPLVMRWPGVIEAGRREGALVQNIDLAATLCELAGTPAPTLNQGRSLVPLVAGREPAGWREAIYYHYYEWGTHNVAPHFGVRTERYKWIVYPGVEGESEAAVELFDLEADPHELHSVHADPAYAGRRAELEARLAQMRVAVGES